MDGHQEGEQPDGGDGVIVAHLRVFLAAILGFSICRQAASGNPDPQLIGSIDEQTGEYMLSS